MTDFLSSVKADLLDRRLLPILALLGVGLAAALAYAVLGGGGSTGATPAPATSPAPGAAGGSSIAVSQAQTRSGQAVAETTSGSPQEGGSARNPFTPLPGATSTSTTSTTKAAGSSTKAASGSSITGSGSTTTSKSGSGSSPQSPAGTPPTTTPKPSSPAKLQTVYRVAVLFGVAPAGTPPQSANLTPYENLKRQTALPSSRQPVVVFRGITAGGRSATFTLVGEGILRGAAVCLSSPSRCQTIDLQPGRTEELEYRPASGAAITYRLQVVSITASKASTAAAQRAFRSQSKAGLELLRRIGRVALSGLRYSSANGVLVFTGHPALAGR